MGDHKPRPNRSRWEKETNLNKLTASGLRINGINPSDFSTIKDMPHGTVTRTVTDATIADYRFAYGIFRKDGVTYHCPVHAQTIRGPSKALSNVTSLTLPPSPNATVKKTTAPRGNILQNGCQQKNGRATNCPRSMMQEQKYAVKDYEQKAMDVITKECEWET